MREELENLRRENERLQCERDAMKLERDTSLREKEQLQAELNNRNDVIHHLQDHVVSILPPIVIWPLYICLDLSKRG